jgi:hypothetical protein
MNTLLLIAIPLGLVILGMILNSFGLSFAHPPSSREQDPAKRVADERDTYRKFFDLQRSQSMKRQKRVGQYGWLLMASFVGAFIWLYADTVSKTTVSTQIASLQTLATEETKQMVLSMTLGDGSNVKYLIKLPERLVQPKAENLAAAAAPEISMEKVSKWEVERLGTALSIGDNPLPMGVALKISQVAAAAR